MHAVPWDLVVVDEAHRLRGNIIANTLKQALAQSRCEWSRDDYSLEVADLGQAPPAAGQQGLGFEE